MVKYLDIWISSKEPLKFETLQKGLVSIWLMHAKIEQCSNFQPWHFSWKKIGMNTFFFSFAKGKLHQGVSFHSTAEARGSFQLKL